MISRGFKIALVVLLAAAGGVSATVLHLENVRLRRHLATAEQNRRQATQLRADNERTRAVLARAAANDAESVRSIQDDLQRLRLEVAALEKSAQARAGAAQALAQGDAQALEQNRDPEVGLMRLEHFRDVGQNTPAAAFQTFVWAAMRGDEARQAGMIVFAGAGRATAEAIVAALPEPDRAKYSTPEKLAALFFADAFTQMPAAHVTSATLTDPQHAVLTVRGLTPREQKIPLQLGPAGWQIAIPENAGRGLENWVRRKTQAGAEK
jgi:hypothetical protein